MRFYQYKQGAFGMDGRQRWTISIGLTLCGVRDGGKRGGVLRGSVRGNVCVMHSGSGVGVNVA